jgi:hypothetical protein
VKRLDDRYSATFRALFEFFPGSHRVWEVFAPDAARIVVDTK